MDRTPDPALRAAQAAKAAEQRFLSLPARTFIDELSTSFAAAEAEWEAADEAFADATPISPQGALAKVQALAHLLAELGDSSLEMRHLRTLRAYIQGLIDEPGREGRHRLPACPDKQA